VDFWKDEERERGKDDGFCDEKEREKERTLTFSPTEGGRALAASVMVLEEMKPVRPGNVKERKKKGELKWDASERERKNGKRTNQSSSREACRECSGPGAIRGRRDEWGGGRKRKRRRGEERRERTVSRSGFDAARASHSSRRTGRKRDGSVERRQIDEEGREDTHGYPPP